MAFTIFLNLKGEFLMSKLVYGKKEQVKFNSEKEKEEAIEYLLSGTPNVSFVREDNQKQGAWGSEYRIHFKSKDGVPTCLLEIMTAGRPGIIGRINCEEFMDELFNRGLRF